MRNPFDRFFKQLGRKLLSPAGPVETDAEVSPDTRRIDLWCNPDPKRARKVLTPLGLFGRMAMRACVLEHYHRTPSVELVADSIVRHRLFCRELARRKPPPPPPIQWVLSSGRAAEALSGLRFRRSRLGRGIYEAPAVWRTRLVVLSELPETRDSLLLRLLGAGRTLRRAVAEAARLPEEAPERRLALQLLVELRLEVPADPAKQTRHEQEFLMSTVDVDRYLSDIKRAGVEEGLKRGRDEFADAVLSVCRTRFGSAPAALTSAVKAASDAAELRRLLDLVTTLSSKEELTAALGAKAGRQAGAKASPRARAKSRAGLGASAHNVRQSVPRG
jgi:hypothetical protein